MTAPLWVRFALATLWFCLGAIVCVVVVAYVYSRPSTITIPQPVILPQFNKSEPSFVLSYTAPSAMTVGDVADVRLHIDNKHLVFLDKKTRRPGTPLVMVSLHVAANCAATADSPTAQGFPARGLVSAFEWSVVATKAGQCELAFSTSLPAAGVVQLNKMTVAVYGRFTPAETVLMVCAVIGALGVLGAAIITARGSIAAARIRP